MPIDALNFFTKFGEIMSELANAETFYEADLKKSFHEITSLYWKWSKDLLENGSVSEHYHELHRLEFSAYCAICDDIIRRLSELVRSFDRLYLIDTSQLNVAMEHARQEKVNAESHLNDESKIEECVSSIKSTVEETFKVYSDCKVKRKNIERKALMKWLGIMGVVYGGSMGIYLPILSNMQVLSNFTYGVAVPVTIGLLLLLLLVAIFSQD
jgi:hypothetical protein